MLKVLIKKQISEMLIRTFRRGRINGSGKKANGARSGIGTVILLALAALYLAGAFAALCLSICEDLLTVEMGWMYFVLTGGAAVIFGTFGSIFSTCFSLYLAKDNDLLLSMPIPIRDVILSRLCGVYFMGLLYSGLIIIPAVAVFWITGGVTVSNLIGGLVMILLVSLIVLGLSCLLGWVVAKLSQRLKNRSFLTVLIALVFVGLYYFVYFKVMKEVQNLLTVMIRVGESIRNSAYPIYLFGRIGEGDWLGMLCWTVGVALLMALIWVILKKSFLNISTATPTPKRAVYREKTARQGSVSAALFRKEWYRFTTSANYMLNCGMALLLLLGFGIYLLVQGNKLLSALKLSSGLGSIIPVMLCAVCCMLGGMVDISTPSVSLEGRSIWQVQCLPVTPWQVLRAKLFLHLSLAAVPTLFCSVVIVLLAPASAVEKLLMFAVSILNAILFALYGLFLGLKMPNLNWTNEITPIKQSAPVFLSIFSGIGLSMAFAGLCLGLGRELGATVWLGIFALLFLVLDTVLYLWLKGPGSRRFANL